jgi:molybdenum cofactor cytidylyltransferase
VESLPEDAAGAFLFLGDMPKIPRAVLQPMAAALAAGAPAVATWFDGRRGHPVLVSRELFAALTALSGDRGAAPVIAALGEKLALVEAPDDGVHFDVDHPSDLQRGRAAAI